MLLNNKPFQIIEHKGSTVIGCHKRQKQLIHISTLSLRHEILIYSFMAMYKTPEGLRPGVIHRNNYQVQSFKLNYINTSNKVSTIDVDPTIDYLPVNIITHPNLIRTPSKDYLIANYDWILAETTEGRKVGVYYKDTLLTEQGLFTILSIIKPVKRNAKRDFCPKLMDFKDRARIGRKYQYMTSSGDMKSRRDYRTTIDDHNFRTNNYNLC